MIRRVVFLLLGLQLAAALLVAATLHKYWQPAGPLYWQLLLELCYLLLGIALVLVLRLLISANNFRLSLRDQPDAPVLSLPRLCMLLAHEYCSNLKTTSYDMLHPVGLQLPPGQHGLPVLLIHGYGCNSGYWRPLSGLLNQAGIAHLGVDLEPPGASIDDFAPQVRAAIEQLCAATGQQRVVIVGHSMGGLVARAYLRRYGADAVARVITLGTPHQGTALSLARYGPGQNVQQMLYDSEWLRTLAAGEANLQRGLFSTIYTLHDNIVAPAQSALLTGARQLAFEGIGHVALGRHAQTLPRVMDEILTATRL
ncbi:esterase/lipase family protein [Pseudoduganella danionis]|uniref:Alpha/beta fold hydrolase n=1 Tax=Pseudoduganella danionis TaxID=1890295 RepID=A0ABW9SJR6_9BURK|nr:alpha/beta fold hydrolase [Pseudoduganella danionis]MTW32242.1 alpha/beta fold hydrolase [Pseudoduganella danionis]